MITQGQSSIFELESARSILVDGSCAYAVLLSLSGGGHSRSSKRW
jgi:hypothetical protein